ncbi:MAG: PilZ domain-containing protein [Candidatus Omnitrophica bacterium]|jgi:c-di-GMP-binding flagellar brake protein YcgR|nr:PilZ domain-containing protein [Candidatus Omnitrophota bacterium]
MQERRKHPRVDISFPVECDEMSHKNYFYTVSKDLSAGGVRIVSNKFLPKNEQIKISINLIDKMVNLNAKVAWCNEARASDNYLCGLEFIEANKSSRNEISGFLSKINQ